MRTSGHRIGAQALAYLAAKTAPAVAGYVLLPVLVRSMTAEEFTRYGQGMALVNALIGFAAGWMNQSQMRFVHQSEQAELRVAKGLAFIANLLGGALLVGAVGLWAGAGGWTEILLYAAMLTGLMVTTDALARQATRRFVSMELARSALLVGAILLAAYAFQSLSSRLVLMVVALSYLAPVAWHLPALGRLGERHLVIISLQVKGLFAALWRFGWPVGAWICLTSAMQILDRSFARQTFGVEASAHYIAVFEVYFRGVSLVLFPLLMAAYPEMIKRWSSGNRDGAIRLGRRVHRLQAYAFVPCVLLSGLSVDWLMPILGKTAAPSDRIMAATFACGAIIWQWALVAHKPLELEHRTPVMLILALVSVATFAATLWTAGRFGLVSVATAYVVSGLTYIVGCRVVLRSLNASEGLSSG